MGLLFTVWGFGFWVCGGTAVLSRGRSGDMAVLVLYGRSGDNVVLIWGRSGLTAVFVVPRSYQNKRAIHTENIRSVM